MGILKLTQPSQVSSEYFEGTKQSGSKLIPMRAEGAVKWSTEAWGAREGLLQEVGSAESTDVEISKELEKRNCYFLREQWQDCESAR